MNQLDLTDIYRRLQPTTAAATFFSKAQGTFTKIDLSEMFITALCIIVKNLK